MTVCCHGPSPLCRCLLLPYGTWHWVLLSRETVCSQFISLTVCSGLLSEPTSPSAPPARMSSQTDLRLLKHNHSSFIRMWLYNNRASPLQKERECSVYEDSLLSRISRKITGHAVQSFGWRTNDDNASLMSKKFPQNYKAVPVDVELQSAVAGWLRALFPSLVNLKE